MAEWRKQNPGHLFRLYRYRRPVPVFVANRMSQIGIGRLFEAVRKQVKDLKYTVQDH